MGTAAAAGHSWRAQSCPGGIHRSRNPSGNPSQEWPCCRAAPVLGKVTPGPSPPARGDPCASAQESLQSHSPPLPSSLQEFLGGSRLFFPICSSLSPDLLLLLSSPSRSLLGLQRKESPFPVLICKVKGGRSSLLPRGR